MIKQMKIPRLRTKNNINYKENELLYDVQAGKLFSVFLIINSINISLKTIWPESDITNYLSTILGIVFLISLIRKKELLNFTFAGNIILESVFFVLIVSSILRYPEAASRIVQRCIWTVAFCIPFLVVCRYVKSIDVFVRQTLYASFIVTAFGILIYFNSRGLDSSSVYSMTMSYMMLFPTLLHVMQIENNKLYMVIILIELYIITLYGSRGALFCIMAFIGFWFFLSRINTARKLFVKTALLIIVFITTVFLYTNADSLLSYLWMTGYSSRTLNLLLSGSGLTHDSGRSLIHQMVWERIMEKPLLGWGIYGQASFMNTYSHSIFLDLLLEYGIPVGGFICVIIVLLLIRGVYKNITNIKYYLLFVCAGFLPLLASGTYLQAPIFWALLGLSLPSKHYFRLRIKLE